MSLRLTLEAKDKIVRRVENSLFEKRRTELQERENQIAEAVLSIALGDRERQFSATPASWLPKATSIRFAYGDDDFAFVNFSESRRVPAYCVHNAATRLPKSHLVVRRYCRLKEAKRKLYDDENALRREVYKVAAGCRTAKQFVEAWPNGEKYVPAEWLEASKALIPSAEKLDEIVATLSGAA